MSELKVRPKHTWNEYQDLVLNELEKLSVEVTRLADLLVTQDIAHKALATDFLILKVKAGLVGGVMGAVSGAVITYLVGHVLKP